MPKYNPSEHNDLRPNVGVTVAAFIYQDGELKVLTYKRSSDSEVFAGLVSLPNSPYLRDMSDSDSAAVDALEAKTGLRFPVKKYSFYTGDYIDPSRINTVNLAYIAMGDLGGFTGNSIISENAEWRGVKSLLAIERSQWAFNHKEILESAVDQVKAWAEYTTFTLELLPERFTIAEFRDMTKHLIDEHIDNSRFRDRVAQTNVINICEGQMKNGSGRAAQLYTINREYTGFFYPKSLTKPK
jgi:8-oxo-dGTP diphosphatase